MINKEKKLPINLIAISGRMGSGKDLVGKIVKRLIFWKKYGKDSEFIGECEYYSGIKNINFKKFWDYCEEFNV